MAKVLDNGRSGLVLVGEGRGRTLIPRGSPLTRLNYFDGKLLQAEDLRIEQEYVRKLVQLSNRAGGSGVVHGFDLSTGSGDELRLGPGMAVDGTGRVLLLPTEAQVGVPALLEASRRGEVQAVQIARDGSARFVECELVDEPAEEEGIPGRELYLIVVTHAEALCGQEDVHGRLCERACETDTARPYRIEGVSLRALPLSLDAPLPGATAVTLDRRHLRSRIASAFFRAEDRVPGDLLSRAGLSSSTWCRGAREDGTGSVPLGVLAREGDTTLFLDAWTARRERMEAPPRRYWAGRMAMRPWNAYLAQILQFQCQLVDVLGREPEPGTGDDPCAEEKEALVEAREYLHKLEGRLSGGTGEAVEGGTASTLADLDPQGALPGGIQELTSLSQRVIAALRSFSGAGSRRVMVDGGIVELPPAGYLPVAPDSAVSVNRQVRELMGEGVDLRFCVVRPDFPAHALEEAQHMERISLLDGLDDASDRPEVDVLVPDGEVGEARATPGLYDVTVEVTPPAEAYGDAVRMRNIAMPSLTHLSEAGEVELPSASVRGVARHRAAGSEGGILRWAGSPAALDSPIAGLLGRALGEVFEEDGAADGDAEGGAGDEIQPNEPRISATDTIDTTEPGPEDLDAGLWTTFRYDADPFALDEGDRLPCRLEAALGAAAEGRAGAVEVEAEGSLLVQEVVADEQEDRWMLEGRFRRVVLLLKPTLDGEPHRVESNSISLSAEIELRSSGDGPARLVLRVEHESGTSITVTGVRKEAHVDGVLRVRTVERSDPESRITESKTATEGVIEGVVRTLDDRSPVPGANVVLAETNRGTSTNAEGRFVIQEVFGRDQKVVVSMVGMKSAEIVVDVLDGQPGSELDVLLAPEGATTEERVFEPARATAERTDRVLETDHPAHERSVAALSLVGEGLADPTFRPQAEAELFGEVEASESSPIRATRDWVLFHRRRTKECAPRPSRPERVRDRRYRVYHLEIGEVADTSARPSLSELERAVEEAGEDATPSLLSQYASALLDAGRVQEAIAVFDRAIEGLHEAGEEPSPELLLDYATAHLRAGNVARAADVVNQVREARGAQRLSATEADAVMEAIEAEWKRLDATGEEVEVEPIVEALRSDDPDALADYRIEEVGTVTFAGDGVSLTTPTTRILEAWRSAGPGESILLGAIGTRGKALEDGVVLAEGRLDRLEGTLERVTPLHDDAISVALPGVPPPLDVTGADGVVVVATAVKAEQEVETDCVNLFRRVVPRHQVDTVLSMIEEGMLGEMASFATARFREGTTELASGRDELEEAWLDAEDGQVRQVWVYHAEDGSITVQQAAEPARAMDLDPETRVLSPPVQIEGPCARADWVVLADDHRVVTADAAAFGSVDEISSLVAEVGVERADLELVDVDGPVLFDVDTTNFLHGSVAVKAAWDEMNTEFSSEGGLAVLSVSRPEIPDSRVQGHGEQARAIRDFLDMEDVPVSTVQSANLGGFGDVAAITMILRFGVVE